MKDDSFCLHCWRMKSAEEEERDDERRRMLIYSRHKTYDFVNGNAEWRESANQK